MIINSSIDFKCREGDFLELKDSSIFEVKGLIHPNNKCVSFPRYIPNKIGNRNKNNRNYLKIYSLTERYNLLKKTYPHFLVYDTFLNMEIPEVPIEEIKRHYCPKEILKEIMKKEVPDILEKKAISFVNLIEDLSEISSVNIGISGSIMIGLHTIDSDIDFIIYGKNESKKIRNLLNMMLNEKSHIRYLNISEMEKLYKFREAYKAMTFETFSRHENRKTFQGIFLDKEFFIRYLPNWSEINEKYGDKIYIPMGNVKIKAIIKDDSESFLSPCKYILDQVEVINGPNDIIINEVCSFRGRFCEQAMVGEKVVIQGKLEKVLSSSGEYYRVILGGSTFDHMISLSLL